MDIHSTYLCKWLKRYLRIHLAPVSGVVYENPYYLTRCAKLNVNLWRCGHVTNLGNQPGELARAAPTPLSLKFHIERETLEDWLKDQRSEQTRRNYRQNTAAFFRWLYQEDPSPEVVAGFLQLEQGQAIAAVVNYRAWLRENGSKEATRNAHIAAIKSLVKFGRKLGKCSYSLEDLTSEPVTAYRDTRGVDAATYKRMLALCDRSTLAGSRDYALLRLLWDTALRRGEVSKASLEDLDASRLWILGKGRGSQKEAITLAGKTQEAIAQWLEVRQQQQGKLKPADPLFCALDKAHLGQRLSGTSIYRIVRAKAEAAGVQRIFSPHRVRHSSITAALDTNQGNVRATQQFSRHRSMETVQRYDDNRIDLQGQIANTVADLV